MEIIAEKFDSISHFIQMGGFEYRIFDMGRKVSSISNKCFEQIENQQKVYPFPFQKKAWLALLIWEADKEHEATIWFLQFPIDELGFLKQEARDAFLIELLEQAGKNIQAKQKGSKVLDELSESPFAFKPQPERQAMFHALATRELGQSPSHYYQPTREYLAGSLGYEQWQFLGLQGIADVVARLDEGDSETLLIGALAKMPETPLEKFALLLENIHPNKSLTVSLIGLLNKEIESDSPNIKLAAALLRALSGAKPDKLRKLFFLQLLTTEEANSLSSNIEILVVFSGRAWKDLDDELLTLFIERLAAQEQVAFNAVLSDVMMLPNMKQKVLAVMRRPDRSDKLSEKINNFMKLMQT